jgi:hypothetical protein
VSDAFGPQPAIDVGSGALRPLDIKPTDQVNAIVSPNVGGNIYAGLAHPSSVDVFIPLSVDEGPQAISLQPYVTSGLGATTVPATVSISENLPDADSLVRLDNEPQNSLVHGATRSDATRETTLENAFLVAFPAQQITSFAGTVDELVADAEASRPENTARPSVAVQGTFFAGASEIDDAFSTPSPRAGGLMANLLPLDLASLEGDIQAFLQQIDQLGVELSGLLARMNLSPWLVAVAVTAIAGEIARRRLQRSQHGPLLAASEGATFVWFPGLTGPWSPEER